MSNKLHKDFRPKPNNNNIVFWFVRKSLRVFIIMYSIHSIAKRGGHGGLQCCSIAVFL